MKTLAKELPQDVLRGMLAELAVQLGISVETSRIQQAINDASSSLETDSNDAHTLAIMQAALSIGIRLVPVDVSSNDVWQLLLDKFSIAMLDLSEPQPAAWIVSEPAFRHCEACKIDHRGKQISSISKSQWNSIFESVGSGLLFVAQPSLICQRESSTPEVDHHNHGHVGAHDHHDSISPQRRLFRFLKFERQDIWPLVVFGFVVGVLDLATPLAVEQMVTTIGFASFTQPLVWLAVLLFAILSLSACIKGLQFFMVEILQRRIFVRVVGDLSERLPRLERASMDGVHGPEMANRFFDVMTMQKATASLLVEGLALIIQTITGLLLLALYSPFLLAFDIVLVLSMSVVLYLLGRNAVRTAISESLIKYKVAHWLQDVVGNLTAFQVHGGSGLSVDRANRLTVDYLGARRKHFAVLMRQTLFAMILYAVSVSALLSLGVWLVFSKSLSIGQLVASVSVVVVVVGAFAKIGKSLESFYDLMSAVDKVGHLIDLPTVPPARTLNAGVGPVEVRCQSLSVGSTHPITIGSLSVASGARFAIVGEGQCGKSMLLQTLCGLRQPASGLIEIGGVDSREVNRFVGGSMAAIAAEPDIFHGSLIENISMGRVTISYDDVRQALVWVGLWDETLEMPQGLETILQSGGYPLSSNQTIRLCLARAIVGRPRLLLIDGALDNLPPRLRQRIWQTLSDKEMPWTLIVATNDSDIIKSCTDQCELSKSETSREHA